jgi:hypothetical protein
MAWIIISTLKQFIYFNPAISHHLWRSATVVFFARVIAYESNQIQHLKFFAISD